jgi:hypothetical protein
MFRFRDPKQPPVPKPLHARARRCCGFAARNALLGASAAAKASADALRWAAEGRPVPPPAPVPLPVAPPPAPPLPARGVGRPQAIAAAGLALFIVLCVTGVPPHRAVLVVGAVAVGVFALERLFRSDRAASRRPAPPPALPPLDPIPVVVVSPPPPVMARRPTARPAPRCGRSSSKVLPILAVALAVGIAVSASGVRSGRRASIDPPPAPQEMRRLGPAKLTDYATDNGVLGGAKAALQVLEDRTRDKLTATAALQPLPPAAPILPIPPLPVPPPPPPVPADKAVRVALHLTPDPAAKPKAAVKLTGVKSDKPHATRPEAEADLLLVAQLRLADQFAKLDPPLDVTPSLNRIRTDYLREDSVKKVDPTPEDVQAWKQVDPELGANRFWVTADVEVSEEQVRQLRGDRRLAAAGPVFLLPLILAGGLYGFLRLDAWTKGHLTGGLVAVVGGLVIAAATVAALLAPW